MPIYVAPDHFSTGVWRRDSAGPVLRHHTCVECGARCNSFESFKAHRARCRDGQPSLVAEVDVAALEALLLLVEDEEAAASSPG